MSSMQTKVLLIDQRLGCLGSIGKSKNLGFPVWSNVRRKPHVPLFESISEYRGRLEKGGGGTAFHVYMLAPGVFGNWRGDADTEAISRIVCTHVFVHYTASSEDLQLRMKAWIEGLEWHQAWNCIGIWFQDFIWRNQLRISQVSCGIPCQVRVCRTKHLMRSWQFAPRWMNWWYDLGFVKDLYLHVVHVFVAVSAVEV